VTVIVEVPVGVEGLTETAIVDEPEPGAAIESGVKVATAPEGKPEAESETAELNDPDMVVEIVELAAVPCCIDRVDGESETEKSLEGLNCTSKTGCSSIPLGATPVWPCKKSNIPTPVIVTGMFAV